MDMTFHREERFCVWCVIRHFVGKEGVSWMLRVELKNGGHAPCKGRLKDYIGFKIHKFFKLSNFTLQRLELILIFKLHICEMSGQVSWFGCLDFVLLLLDYGSLKNPNQNSKFVLFLHLYCLIMNFNQCKLDNT
jgi:hypothetical protein